MKKLLIFAGVLLLATACDMKKGTDNTAASSTEASASTDYPYTLKDPYKDWQTGDQKNAVLVLKMIKAWETKNLAECATYFGDTTDMSLDMYHSKMSNDSIVSFLQGALMDNATIKVHMQDWESVISADKKEEWVTVWYKQVLVNKKGVADSLNVIDDAKIENGKIVVFDEYIQHFPAKKK